MILTYRNLGDVTKAVLIGMAEAGVEESETLDFKLEVPKNGTLDFCKDISAMANTDGGCIVIGMREDPPGTAAETVGIDEPFDVLIRRLQQAAEAHIDPRVAIRFESVELDGGKYVALAAVERSRSRPHQNRHDERIYKRLRRNNQAMNVNELRSAFLESKSQEQLALEEHERYITKSISQQTIVTDEAMYYLSIIPAPFGDEIIDLGDEVARTQIEAMPKFYTGLGRLTFSGRRYSSENGRKACEVLRTGVVHQHSNTTMCGRKIPAPWLQREIPELVNGVRDFYKQHSIDRLAHVCLTIGGVKGYTLDYGPGVWAVDFKPILEERLRFPPLFIGAPQMDLAPLFENWWMRLDQAAGVRITR